MKKMIIPVLAVVLAVSFSAFTPARKAYGTASSMYWYQVDPTSQKILAGTPLYVHAPKEAVETDCDDTGDDDCLRGFSLPQNTASDISSRGQEQIFVTPQ